MAHGVEAGLGHSSSLSSWGQQIPCATEDNTRTSLVWSTGKASDSIGQEELELEHGLR